MKELTNETIWRAGAFDHKRSAVRELDVPRQATWLGITARASQILVDGDCLIVIIAAASVVCPSPSNHDRRNAEISALVFSKQQFAKRFSSVKAYLRDQCARQFEVVIDLACIERRIRIHTLRRSRKNRPAETIPSPLASFLLRQVEKFRF